MNKRLIAFGCSNTYGEGLEDCWIKGPGPKPSKFAWPSVLGTLIEVDEVINVSAPGISNKRIWRDALNFDYRDNDIVFLHWTFVDRDCFFGIVPKIGPWLAKNGPSKIYYRYFWSNLDRHYDLFNRADHVDRYLTSKKIKHYNIQTTGSNSMGGDPYTPEEIPNWCEVDFLPGINLFNRDRALDEMHPGPLTHKTFANNVFNIVKEK